MSGVHREIAVAAFDVLEPSEQELFAPFIGELKASACYPDTFADKSMTSQQKAEIDPDADLVIYPDPPDADWYKKIVALTKRQEDYGTIALREIFLITHYLKRAVEEFKAGNTKLAVKLCGVYSHVIGDCVEPIHAINPEIVDMVLPTPTEHIGLELHANVEGLKAPVNIAAYKPGLLGKNMDQAVMNGYAGLDEAQRIGRAQTIPITQALYRGDRESAVELSARAQNESARKFADFLHTVIWLSKNDEQAESFTLDLCEYPHVSCSVDMLYRYRPMVDVSLVPYSGGKLNPLAISTTDGKVEKVHGLGVVPFLGPPMSKEHYRETTVDYFLVPNAFNTFRARVGVNPLFENSIGAAVFRVICDGKEVYRSDNIAPKSPAAEVEVDLGQTRWLTLAMHYSVNPLRDALKIQPHLSWALHGVWAEPKLECG